MATPHHSETELWRRVCNLWAGDYVWKSLVEKNSYAAARIDEAEKRCEFEYESGNRRWIPLEDLYAVYEELYRMGRLSTAYLRDADNCERVLGRRHWHAPGAAMLALLPHLDDRIVSAEGQLLIKGD